VGGNRAIIEPGVTGLLFDLADPGALAAALAGIFDDPARARELGARARARALERYDLTRLVAEEIALLKRLARPDR
jgi:phosphatidylinositol alpha-1,6-mannosyltransferase